MWWSYGYIHGVSPTLTVNSSDFRETLWVCRAWFADHFCIRWVEVWSKNGATGVKIPNGTDHHFLWKNLVLWIFPYSIFIISQPQPIGFPISITDSDSPWKTASNSIYVREKIWYSLCMFFPITFKVWRPQVWNFFFEKIEFGDLVVYTVR